MSPQIKRRSMSPPEPWITIYTRHDQYLHDIGSNHYFDPEVTIFAPIWLQNCLLILQRFLSGSNLLIQDSTGKVKAEKLGQEFTLVDLVKISRNEPVNVTGKINFSLYSGVNVEYVLGIKDLVRQCVIIGKDDTIYYGGYGINARIEQKRQIVLVDSIGLQFQQDYNTGRLVLVGENIAKGAFDDMIFENVVGEKKKSLDVVKEYVEDLSKRYIKFGKIYFDTYAYQKFVAHDLLLVCLALNQMGWTDVNMKFLKYGCGFFAGEYSSVLDNNIGEGVYIGLEKLFRSGKNKIEAFEFTFYDHYTPIARLCERYGVRCEWSKEDSLKATHPSLMTVTTNCADPHTVTGNEMHYSSVDATIGENIKSKGFKFSPIINTAMKCRFIDCQLKETHNNDGQSCPKDYPVKKVEDGTPSLNNSFIK